MDDLTGNEFRPFEMWEISSLCARVEANGGEVFHNHSLLIFAVPNQIWRKEGDRHRLRQQVREAVGTLYKC